jgi:hypothetical protein
MEAVNFVLAMIIIGVFAYAIHDTLARSLARDDELERLERG